MRSWLWFGAQFVIFCALLIAPLIDRFRGPVVLRFIGLILLGCGVWVAVQGYRVLGTNHSPWVTPVADGQVVATGIYGYVRHPIYLGWFIGSLGFGLLLGSWLGVGVAVVWLIFADLKAREEEKWLRKKYAEYPAYQAQVKRFFPGIY